MIPAKPLPTYILTRYRGWHATTFAENRAWYARLAAEGQRPRAMVIACCDSRVNVTSIFGVESGEFFIHRNIANLVPPCQPDGDLHGTSAAIEYAAKALRVSNIIVMGHSQCGGVEGCLDMCAGRAPELEEAGSFVGRWMDILRSACTSVAHLKDRTEQLRQLERRAVAVSLENLMTFPFIADRVAAGDLSLHGLWHDIAEGGLEWYDPHEDRFQPV